MTRLGRTPLFSRRLTVLAIGALIVLDLFLASRASHLEPRSGAAAPTPTPAAETPCSSQPSGPWLP